MSAIDKFEGMVEGVVEGSMSRLFRSKISLVDIQKRLERTMEQRREVAVGKAYVPNRYEVFLHPSDFQHVTSDILPKIQAEKSLTDHVFNYAQSRSFIFGGGRPLVWLNSNEQVRRRSIMIKAYTVDPNQARAAQAPVPTMTQSGQIPSQSFQADMNGGTSIMNIGALSLNGDHRPGTVARPDASLIALEYGHDNPSRFIRFNKDVTIGRGLDNDVVYSEETRVSRQHARIEFKYGQFLLFDLNSTNGTLVNGRPVTQIVLTPSDRISLGGFEVVFQVG